MLLILVQKLRVTESEDLYTHQKYPKKPTLLTYNNCKKNIREVYSFTL